MRALQLYTRRVGLALGLGVMLPRGGSILRRSAALLLQLDASGPCCSTPLLRCARPNAPRVRRLCISRAEADPYRVLGVPRGCSNKELKQAFRKAAMRWHPDMQAGGDAVEAERMFKRVRALHPIVYRVIINSPWSCCAPGVVGLRGCCCTAQRQTPTSRGYKWYCAATRDVGSPAAAPISSRSVATSAAN
eukprot:COSAG02_NODE_4766_length_5006_cov_2.530263_3_plen_191_part_00